MGKYGRFASREIEAQRPWKIHPIWRGIGCVMAVLIPLLSYAGAVVLVQENATRSKPWIPTLWALMHPVKIPIINYNLPILAAELVVSLALMLVGFALLMVLYSILYSMLGPSRYGPLDSPPIREPVRRSAKHKR